MPHNEDGVGGMHLYMPWWIDNKKLDFPRGYHIEIGGGRRMPGFGFIGNIHLYAGVEVSGTPLPASATARSQGRLSPLLRLDGGVLPGRGEMIPNEKSYLELDPSVVDRFGIPVLRFNFHWTDYEVLQAKHMQETFRAIIDTMGGPPMAPMPAPTQDYGLMAGGRIIHEIGVTRMGKEPKPRSSTPTARRTT